LPRDLDLLVLFFYLTALLALGLRESSEEREEEEGDLWIDFLWDLSLLVMLFFLYSRVVVASWNLLESLKVESECLGLSSDSLIEWWIVFNYCCFSVLDSFFLLSADAFINAFCLI
jgi:hypothetical protein